MARKARELCSSEIYHIIMRGNNEQNIFYDDEDRTNFINRLEFLSKDMNIEIFAYCLMSNHVHILIGNGNQNMSKFVQRLLTSYVRKFNRKYERSGHLFQERFLSKTVEDDEQFKTVLRYILNNSEKAGLGNFDQYIWNSFKKMISEEKSVINKDRIYEIFAGKKNLLTFLKLKNNDVCMEYKSKKLLNDSRGIEIISIVLGVKSPDYLCRLHFDEQIKKIRILLEKGLSKNQICRITGISKGIVKKAC